MNSPDSSRSLVDRMHAGWTPRFVFFWGYTSKRAGGIGKECLSQWYPAPFVVAGHRYPTAEHYMMAQKAELFGDDEAALRIRSARHPADAKALGRAVRDFDSKAWEERRFDIVVAGSYAKFTQNPSLGAYLRATSDAVLVEASPTDCIWGIGLRANDLRAQHPEEWRGRNLLGFALMAARDAIVATAGE